MYLMFHHTQKIISMDYCVTVNQRDAMKHPNKKGWHFKTKAMDMTCFTDWVFVTSYVWNHGRLGHLFGTGR